MGKITKTPLAAIIGIEPICTESKSVALPLGYIAISGDIKTARVHRNITI